MTIMLGGITQFMHRSHIITGMALIAVLGIGCLKGLGQSTNQQAHGEVKQLWEPTIRVQFLGMTNDVAGVKLARFELHNFGKEPWDVSLPGFVDLGMRGGGYFGCTNATLQSGASVETSIPVPTDRDRWRAEFLCNPPTEQIASSIYSEYLPPIREAALAQQYQYLDVLPKADRASVESLDRRQIGRASCRERV